jgi:putative membrane protein
MGKLLVRLVINAVALWVASQLVSGLAIQTSGLNLLIVAIIFGVVNAFIRPIVDLFTCPFYLLTLGLFTFVVNALMLMLTAWISGGRLEVSGFWPAFLGGIVMSIASFLLSILLPDRE